MSEVNISIMIEDVLIGDRRRDINVKAVEKLAQSIDQIGLRHPITVRRRGDKYQLIAGRHRLEACKKLGREHIPASIVAMAGDDARLWEIAENLHRAELTKLERDLQIAEWIQITERISVQLAPKLGRGRPEGGISAAARELGIEETEAKRAVKVASLSEEAQQAARQVGLDDNRSALLEAAGKTTAQEQVAEIHRRKPAPRVVKIADDPMNDMEAAEKQVATLMSAWNKAGPEAREEFLLRIDRPVMDRRYAEA
jgi:ParB family chromosome partitioning protein